MGTLKALTECWGLVLVIQRAFICPFYLSHYNSNALTFHIYDYAQVDACLGIH